MVDFDGSVDLPPGFSVGLENLTGQIVGHPTFIPGDGG
jgi:hypothetical protein